MKCPNHPEADADFTCTRCGRLVCAKCIEDVGGQWVCSQCVAAPQASPPAAPQPQGQPPTPPPGQPWQAPPPPYPRTPQRAGPTALAIVGMICGIVGILVCCIAPFHSLFSIAGLVLGLVALYSAASEDIRAANRPYAIAAVATGAAGLLILLLQLAGVAALSSLIKELPGHFPTRP
jgi:hypothetical protein